MSDCEQPQRSRAAVAKSDNRSPPSAKSGRSHTHACEMLAMGPGAAGPLCPIRFAPTGDCENASAGPTDDRSSSWLLHKAVCENLGRAVGAA